MKREMSFVSEGDREQRRIRNGEREIKHVSNRQQKRIRDGEREMN